MTPEFIDTRYLGPKHWPIWLAIGIQRLLVLLPWFAQRFIGTVIGLVALPIASRRRKVAADNLAIAYPDIGDARRRRLLRQHFQNLGIGIMEIGLAWWARDARIARLCDVEGLQHLSGADNPQATFLVAGHFTSIDMVARGLHLYADFDVMHRPLGIPLLDAFTRYGRRRCATHLIDKRSPKALLASLKKQRAVWFAVDQADTTASSVMAPFFEVPAPTNTTVSRLAERVNAAVVPVSCIRQSNGRYRIVVYPPLDDFGRDVVADATRLNAMVESHINAVPSQYYWIHRRFKSATVKT